MIVTTILENHGWQRKFEIQCIENIYIYPPEYFCPMDHWTGEISLTENTRSIHHYSESWMQLKDQKVNRMLRRLIHKFGKKNGYRIWSVYAFPYRFKKKVNQVGFKGMIKFAVALLLRK